MAEYCYKSILQTPKEFSFVQYHKQGFAGEAKPVLYESDVCVSIARV